LFEREVFLFGNYKISEFAQIFQNSRREEVRRELRQVARSQVSEEVREEEEEEVLFEAPNLGQ